MACEGSGMVRRQVGMLFDLGTIGNLTDRQLLERFRTCGGEAAETAFAALVDRHGPLVFRVCQRALRDPHAAQDAFQATFLVLVRKARTLWVHDSLGPWLHAVAGRVSAYARATEARRKANERKRAETHSPTTAHDFPCDDLGQILHEEIDRLPESYRAAVILCDLQGQTQEQAARLLGWPPGTVRSRLSRGRGRLQARLIRRGLAPSSGVLTALVASESASAAVPAAQASSVVRNALLVAAGQWTGTGTVALSAPLLTEGVIHSMWVSKLKAAAAVVLLVGAGAGGTAVLAYQDGGSLPAQGAGPGNPATVGKAADPTNSVKTVPPLRYDLQDEVNLALANMKEAEERLRWAERMFDKGYLSKAQLEAERGRLAVAKMRLQAANDRKQAIAEAPNAQNPDAIRRKEAQRLEVEARSRQIERAQAQKQLETTTNALQYLLKLKEIKPEAVGILELLKAEADQKVAMAHVALCKTIAKEKEQDGQPAGEPPADPVALQNARLETARAMLQLQNARVDAVMTELTVASLNKARRPGPDTDLEWERAVVLVKETIAACDRLRGEVTKTRTGGSCQERSGDEGPPAPYSDPPCFMKVGGGKPEGGGSWENR